MPKGVDLSEVARITRDKHSKVACLHIETTNPWSIYAGDEVDTIDMSHPILSGTAAGSFELPVTTVTRSYFRLESERESIILAESLLPMRGGYNFRDLGGIKLKGNRTVKWGKLFRADELTHLTESDVEYLGSIPITSVIDFRAEGEIKRSPDKLPLSARFSYPMAITPGNLSSEGIQANLLKANISNHMKQMNRLYVSDPACVRTYRIMFTIIQNNLSAPLIFHCSAGKDRTGMAAALILFALGASEETVLEDYLKSKIHLADKYDAFIARYPRAEPIFTVKKTYLMAAINQIKRDHGSIMDFLTQTLKVDIPRLRRLYLDPL